MEAHRTDSEKIITFAQRGDVLVEPLWLLAPGMIGTGGNTAVVRCRSRARLLSHVLVQSVDCNIAVLLVGRIEPGGRSRYREYAISWTLEESQLDSRQGQERDICLLQKDQTGCGAHPASHLLCTAAAFPWGSFAIPSSRCLEKLSYWLDTAFPTAVVA
jgi:hypothetical protein